MGLGLLSLQTLAQRALLGKLAGIALVLEHAELVTCGRNARQTENLDRVGRTSLGGMVAARIDQGAHTTVARASDNRVARLERTALDENGGNRTATLVEVRLNDEAGSKSVGIGLEFEHVSLQKDGLEQVVNANALLGGNVDEHIRAAPFLGNDTIFHQLLAYAIGRSAGLVDFIDGNHDGHVRSLRVVDGLDGLRHNAVVRRHDQRR